MFKKTHVGVGKMEKMQSYTILNWVSSHGLSLKKLQLLILNGFLLMDFISPITYPIQVETQFVPQKLQIGCIVMETPGKAQMILG